MARALSHHLFERVMAAIETGAFGRRTAEQFGIAKANAIPIAIRGYARY